MNWSRQFPVPLQTPDGKELVTLKDGADYISKLPRSERDKPHWQHAGKRLIKAAEEQKGWAWFAMFAMGTALWEGVERPVRTKRRKRAKAYRIVG